jgi:hypothetical protein
MAKHPKKIPIGDDMEIDADLNIFDGISFKELNDFFKDENDLEERQSRYVKPPKVKVVTVNYSNCEELAAKIKITKGSRHLFEISGNFIFGDFLEALIMENDYLVKKLSISSLGINENNIDSLAGLIELGYIEKLDIVLSTLFLGYYKYDVLKHLLQTLDKDDRLRFAIGAIHTKIALIETACGKHIAIHGSANLRSSGSVEQFCIDECKITYDFFKATHDFILKDYSIINHNVIKSKDLWGEMTKDEYIKSKVIK